MKNPLLQVQQISAMLIASGEVFGAGNDFGKKTIYKALNPQVESSETSEHVIAKSQATPTVTQIQACVQFAESSAFVCFLY